MMIEAFLFFTIQKDDGSTKIFGTYSSISESNINTDAQ